ncbi:DUF5672 family protein [Propionispira raffinosivorans]|uniref:DUF5672 family protein n=1 Tax=Propionispira raffinosivorans TaxID=86959 RepID=UPI000374ACC4|nr:DUF5672 family protein [Propionispira raffinosivorans]
MDRQVVIVVPIYKKKISQFEKISLTQLQNVLGKYPKCFVAPESMVFDYGEEYSDFMIEKFDDKYFQSVGTYSDMMLSIEFYQRFKSYKFLLVYQLDAFVFSDRLNEFCALNFDYIGAPVPLCLWSPLRKRVGNGGFSLRKIQAMITILQNKEYIVQEAANMYPAWLIDDMFQFEDKFFAVCSNLKGIKFNVPEAYKASNFSIEYDANHRYKTLKKYLPFGCHGWYKDNFDIWWSIIQSYGYRYDEAVSLYTNKKNYMELRTDYIITCLYKRIVQEKNIERVRKALNLVLKADLLYSVWGFGIIGKRCVNLLRMCRVGVCAIYETNVNLQKSALNILLQNPKDKDIAMKKSIIIVATKKYEGEVGAKLETVQLKKNVDFIFFSDIEKKLVQVYYRLLNEKY